MMLRTVLYSFSLLVLAACTVGPDYTPPATEVNEQWHSSASMGQQAADSKVQERWWEIFGDVTLKELIEQVAAHNYDVRIALSNIEQARASRREAASGFWPSLTASTRGVREGLSNKTTSNSNNTGAKERDVYSADLDASWELDIFGSIRRQVESAEAQLQAVEEQKRGVLLSVLAEVARNYFEVRGTQKRIAVTEQNIALVREVEELAKTQLEYGVATDLDVARARGEREAIEATLPLLRAQLQAGIYRLSVLSGQPPESYAELLSLRAPLPTPPEIVPVGLRSELLRRRPDIREAERNLAAAMADIGVATADLFPSFSLTGGLGSTAAEIGDIVSQGAVTYAFGQVINWPLFQGGALRARITQAEAGAETALLNYEQTVLLALEDAENSLNSFEREEDTFERLRASAATREEAFSYARLRYEAGEENFLVILDAERTLVDAQDAVIQSEIRLMSNLTQLYKSLGGGWQTFETAPAKEE